MLQRLKRLKRWVEYMIAPLNETGTGVEAKAGGLQALALLEPETLSAYTEQICKAVLADSAIVSEVQPYLTVAHTHAYRSARRSSPTQPSSRR